MKIYTNTIPFNADTYTPVGIYTALRHNYRNVCLMESNDYHSRQDSKSIIGFEPLVEVQKVGNKVSVKMNNFTETIPFKSDKTARQLQELLSAYEIDSNGNNGFIGRFGFEFNHVDETGTTTSKKNRLPEVHLFLFKFLIVIDHFTNEGTIIENAFENHFTISDFKDLSLNYSSTNLPFEVIGNERAQFSDDTFHALVKKSIEHCKKGDVFQLVVSNEFQQTYFGDDFQVYRKLRRLNPSPYLFYFDFESYRLFGSSPEAQLVIKNGKCEIHPIAGTIPRTGIEETDAVQLDFLLSDAKENAEHTMLVDLARNDLSRDCHTVKVERYKEIQHFSHVTHLVSKVTGKLNSSHSIEALSNSFPAGTLSGTPKPKALQLIDQFESIPRDFYGGAIGIILPEGDLNMAIVIRSILSQNNNLHYRAGAGVVIDSIPEREVQEIHHKLRAVRTAIHQTQEQFKPITL